MAEEAAAAAAAAANGGNAYDAGAFDKKMSELYVIHTQCTLSAASNACVV